MKLNQLEKATKILERIKVLDAEIIDIDKFAILVARGETRINLEIKCEDLRKNEDEKQLFDSDGSLTNNHALDGSQYFLHGIFMEGLLTKFNKIQQKPKHGATIKKELSDTSTLSILGVILSEKKSERSILIQSIKNLGFTL